MSEKITVVIPTFNEARNIGFVLRTVLEWRNLDPKNRFVVVADDGSRDKTVEIAKSFDVKVVFSHPSRSNCGKCAAVIAGAKAAVQNGSTIVVTMDADVRNLKPQQIDVLVNSLVEKKLNMTIGRTKESKFDIFPIGKISGERAIRLSVFSALFNRKSFLEIANGFGLERALNHFIPKHEILPTKGANGVIFLTATPFRKGIIRQNLRLLDAYLRIYERKVLARRLKRYRKKGKHKEARAVLKLKRAV